MFEWLKDRWEILRLSLARPGIFILLALFQAAALALDYFHSPFSGNPALHWLLGIPWYGWAIAWLVFFWLSTLSYSVDRKKTFDETSVNFFKAYLDHLVKEGHHLFQFAGEKDFYSKISHWQRKIIEGIAIGLGPEQSKGFFHKMEGQSPLSEAYRQSQASKSHEPLSKAIQARLDELGQIRLSLPEKEDKETTELAVGGASPPGPVPAQPAGLLPGDVEPPPMKRLPKK